MTRRLGSIPIPASLPAYTIPPLQGLEVCVDRRRFSIAACAAAVVWPAGPLRAQPRDISAQVHRATSLLGLSQRLSKAYALLGLNIEADLARAAVAECSASSGKLLEQLLTAPPTPASHAAYVALHRLWARARDLTQAAPTTKSLDALLVLDAQMLGIANEAVAPLLRQGAAAEVAAVDTAGRLSMLSQRIAKFHFCALWGVAPKLSATQMAKAKEEFLAHLKTLQGVARTGPQRDAIAAAQSQWVFFDAALQNASLGAEAGLHARLARSSEAILLVFTEVAGKFARIA